MTHAIHKRFNNPTGVEHCIKATFISPNQINLIVAKTTVLHIYALRKTSKPKDDPKHPIARLDLIREFQLFGNVQAIGVVRLPDKATDSLVLGFPDAKISVVEWNPAIDDLEISGLHFYENDEQLKEGHCRVVNKPQLVVSHDSKCAVMLSYERQLIVVPFRPESEHLDPNVIYSETDITRKFPSTYIIHLPSIGILHVKDMAFLKGYYEPTLLILYEPFQTYGTRLPSRKNTACITALSLNLNKKSHPVVWSKCNLPYDAYSIIPVPLPIGGVIVVAANSIFYFNQTTDYGMSFNHFGDTQGSPYRTEKSDIVLVLDNACGTWLNTDSLLISVDSGDLYLLRLFTDGRTVTRFTIESRVMIEKRMYNVRDEVPMEEKISPGIIASCMCTLSEEFFYIGSHVGDSSLVQYREKITPIIKTENNGEAVGNISGERPLKRSKLNHNGDEPIIKQEEERTLDRPQKPNDLEKIRKFENDGLREYTNTNEYSQNKKLGGSIPENGEATDDPWDDLEASVETDEDRKLLDVFRESYNRRNWESRNKKKDYEFEICDIIPNIGPIVDVTIQPSLDDATVSTIEETDEKIFNTKSRRKVELVCCSGRGKNGALTIIQRGVRPEINTSVEVPGCRALWGVFHRTRTDENVRGAEEETLWTRYLVLSRDDGTMVLETGDIIQEISNAVEFFTDGPTQNVGNLFNNHRIAQVHSNGVILLDGVMRTQEWTVPSPEFTVIASSIKDPYVLLQLNNRSLILLEAVVKQSDFNLVNTGITFDNQSPVSAFYLFRDESCCPIFNTTKEEADQRQHRVKLSKRKRQSTSTTTTAPVATPIATASTVAKMISGIAELPGLKNKVEDPFSHAMNNDPEELEVYGYNNNPGTPDFYTDETIPPDNIVRPFYCALTLDDGAIQIYRFVKPDNTDSNKSKGQTGEDDQNQELEREALSTVERVFHASRFSDGPPLLSDESLDYIEAIDVGSGRNKKTT